MTRYRVLRPGLSQRELPGGPLVDREVGDLVEVGDEMAAYLLAQPDPLIEKVSGRRRKKDEDGEEDE